MRLVTGATLFLVLTLASAGQETANPTAATALTDAQISEGLAGISAFLEKSVPADARWVRVETPGREIGLLSAPGDGADIKGNGFLAREIRGVKAEVWMPVMSGIVTLSSGNAAEENEQSFYNPYMAVNLNLNGSWKAADLAHDITEATALLQKQLDRAKKAAVSKVVDQPDAEPQISGFPTSNDPRAVLRVARYSALLWAAALQRTGHKTEALAVGQAALKDSTEAERKGLLDQMFDFVPKLLWQHRLGEFRSQHDWKRLRDDLQDLVKTFGTGWRNAEAARVLLRQLNERAEQPDDPPLKLNPPLPEAEQRELRDWLNSMSGNSPTQYSTWSLLPTLAPDGTDPDETKPAARKTFPASKGIVAVPMLVALLRDETLMPIQMMAMDPSDAFGGGSDPVDRLKQAFAQLPKPTDRAHLAWNKLEQVLPGQMRNSVQGTLAERAETVMQWYSSIKDAPPSDIALSYLEGGDQTPNVIANALKTTDPKKVSRLEDALVETSSAYSLEQIEAYVRQNGARASSMLKKLRVKLEADLGNYAGGGDQMRKTLEKSLQRLESLAKGELKLRSPDELLPIIGKVTSDNDGAVVSEEMADAADAWKDLPAALAKLSSQDRLKVVLKHLPDFKSSQAVTQVYQMLLYPPFGREPNGPDVSLKLDAAQRKQALAETKEQWQRLLTASFPDLNDDEDQQNFALGTELTIQSIAGGRPLQEIYGELNNYSPLGSRMVEMVKAMALACLEGKKPAPWPDAKAVPENEVTQLMADLGGLDPKTLSQRLNALDPSRILALYKALVAQDAWPQGFLKLATSIGRVELTGVHNEAAWRTWEGKPVNFENIAALAKQTSGLDEGNVNKVILSLASPMEGWILRVRATNQIEKLREAGQFYSLASQTGNDEEQIAKFCRTVTAGMCYTQRHIITQMTWFDAPHVPNGDKASESALEKLPGALQAYARQEEPAWIGIREIFTASSKPLLSETKLQFLSVKSTALDEAAKRIREKQKDQ